MSPLPTTISACGVELRLVGKPTRSGHARWECVLLPGSRTRIGIEVDDFNRDDLPPVWRGYITSDGGPDVGTAHHSTQDEAVRDLERVVFVLWAAFRELPAMKEATR